MTRPTWRMAAYGAVVVVVLLLVAVIATRTPTGELIWPVESSATQDVDGPGPGQNQDPEEGEGEFTQEVDYTDAGFTVINVFWLAVFAVVVMVVTLLFVKERARPSSLDEDEQQLHDEGHRGSLRDVTSVAVDEAIERLDAGATADHVIVECWRALGRAAAAEGVAADRSRTSSELVAAVVEATSASPEEVEELAELYRTARYSGRLATEVDIGRARACLTSIQGALR